MSAINVLAHESIQTPSVAWTGLLPIIILAAAGILLLTICSLFPEKVTNKFASVYTQLAAVAALSSTFSLWDKVQNKSEGPYSTLAGAFGVASSVWNQKRGADKIVFRLIEKCSTFSDEDEDEDAIPPTPRDDGDEEPPMDDGEPKEEEEWNTMLYEMDAQTTELETVVAEPVISNQVRCTIIGAKESDSEWTETAEAGALSHAYMKYCFQGKCPPEAEEVLRDTNAEYVSTIRSLLRLTRVLSFA